ncbi:MAG: response regulator [Bdellovibrionia bacterium]
MDLEDCEVLIVDDVMSFRVHIQEILEKAGFKKISQTENGVAAKIHLASRRCDLILSDWFMYPMTGLDLLKWVRTESRMKEVPFVMVTAQRTREAVLQAAEYRVDDYLVKPVSLQQLQEKLISLLTRKKVIS